MPKYEVRWSEVIYYSTIIEADNADEAEQIAWAEPLDTTIKDSETEVLSVREVAGV